MICIGNRWKIVLMLNNMKFNFYILIILMGTIAFCKDNILWDHGIVIKKTKDKESDIKFSIAKDKILPTIESNSIINTQPLINIKSQSTKKLYSDAAKEYGMGYYNQAQIKLEECYSRDKENIDIVYLLSQIYIKTADYKRAITILEKLQNHSEHTLMLLSIVYKRNSEYKKSDLCVELLLHKFPDTHYKRILSVK